MMRRARDVVGALRDKNSKTNVNAAHFEFDTDSANADTDAGKDRNTKRERPPYPLGPPSPKSSQAC